jgi:hypothetical protein
MTDPQLYLAIGVPSLALVLGPIGQLLFVVWYTKQQIRRFGQGR